MAEHPIIFNTEMVRAILDGRKTQTRRIIRPQPETLKPLGEKGQMIPYRRGKEVPDMPGVPLWEPIKCPYGQGGDRLWVREATKHYGNMFNEGRGYAFVEYKDEKKREIDLTYILDAGKDLPQKDSWWKGESKWTSARFMFKWATRIFLEITNIRVERVRDISEEDCGAEGIQGRHCNSGVGGHMHHDTIYPAFPDKRGGFHTAKDAFEQLWDSLNAKRGYGWDSNPFVWVIEFSKITEPS